MSSRFQSAVLGSSPLYPSAVVWSDENLVAVACGSTVSILNPANPVVRGVITIPSSEPFPLGVIDGGEEDLLHGCLLPFHLSRDARPCVRSISWSPVGLANNAGCLLAVCTTGGRVKLYRFPFCEFSVEWIEVMDVSEMLYNYFKTTSFGESQIISSESSDVAAQDWQIIPVSGRNGKTQEKVSADCNLPLITVQQYASRSAMLMSLTVAWSPILGTSGNGVTIPHNSSTYCSILAIGGKCGRISLWRIHAPEIYSIDSAKSSSKVSLVGLLKAHDSWITAINWALYEFDVSKPHLVLATGSSDGRVKIWRVNVEELLMSSEVIHDSFSLLKEVMMADSATISVLSLIVPTQTPWKLLLAIGKGSGSIEVWILDMSISKFEKVGCCNAHQRIVTGLAWAFDGRCLYSCSQDNSMKSWILVGNSLCEVPNPSHSPGLKSSPDVPYVFDSCFGLAVSPGNLAIAVARKYDVDLLNPMYQGRTHRAAVEFLWIGGQQLDMSSGACPDIDNESFPGLPEKVLIWWECNMLWSLSQYENPSRLLNIWDIVAALLAFKQSAPEYVEHILLKWLTSYFGSQFGNSSTLLSEAFEFLPKLSSRQLHLINIISRHVVLKERKADHMSSKQQELKGLSATNEQVNLWMELLLSSENELLERLVGFSFSAFLSLLSNSSVDSFEVGCGSLDGLRQMEQWVSHNEKNVKDHSKFLAAKVGKVEKR
ncbi:UNVERIFIED_CONTAM: hypothetical protein Sradi_6634600 [Sesamum radiatum]|uniref:Transcription factor IIIC 90kDa subunit N-terminal domain-containing protein n=1 Tax=Sesamum radiatum TaxID=300843 RepID=A0AAW2K076_SESRA